MAIINSYPTITPTSSDLVLITDVSAEGNPTKTASVGSILSLADSSYIKSDKIQVTAAELKTLHTTPKVLVDVTVGNPKEICQVYSVVLEVNGNSVANNLVFPNDLTIQSNNASPWSYVIPQATANSQLITYYVPSLTAGTTNFDTDVVLSSAGAAVETGTAVTSITVWITYRIYNILD